MSMDRKYQDALFARMADVYGWEPIRRFRDERIEWASNVLGEPVESFRSLDNDQARELLEQIRIDELELIAAGHDPDSF